MLVQLAKNSRTTLAQIQVSTVLHKSVLYKVWIREVDMGTFTDKKDMIKYVRELAR
jgi:hypothetical protein